MSTKRNQIRRLLWDEWDPIGVNGFGPNDEYDGYADRILSMLQEGKREPEITEYLRWAAAENMGLSNSRDPSHIAQAACAIFKEKE